MAVEETGQDRRCHAAYIRVCRLRQPRCIPLRPVTCPTPAVESSGFLLAPRAGCKASKASFALLSYKRSTRCSVEGAFGGYFFGLLLASSGFLGRLPLAFGFLPYFFFLLRVELERLPVGQ